MKKMANPLPPFDRPEGKPPPPPAPPKKRKGLPDIPCPPPPPPPPLRTFKQGFFGCRETEESKQKTRNYENFMRGYNYALNRPVKPELVTFP